MYPNTITVICHSNYQFNHHLNRHNNQLNHIRTISTIIIIIIFIIHLCASFFDVTLSNLHHAIFSFLIIQLLTVSIVFLDRHIQNGMLKFKVCRSTKGEWVANIRDENVVSNLSQWRFNRPHLTVCIVDSNLSHWLVTLWLKRMVLYRTYYDRIQMVVRYLVQPLEKFFHLYDFVITW